MCYEDDVLPRFENEIMPKLSADESWRGETVGLQKDGSTFPQELSLSLTDDGRIICVVRNITERKQREQKLRQQNERLEEFTSVVSHDLRSPLNVAQGRIELVRNEHDSNHLETAAAAIEWSITFVDDLLTLAQQSEQITDLQHVALATIVNKCWRNVGTETSRLVVYTDWQIRADPSRLKQLLENLLRNAVEHGGDDVTVTVGDVPSGFCVEDDGPGIPSDERDSYGRALVFTGSYGQR